MIRSRSIRCAWTALALVVVAALAGPARPTAAQGYTLDEVALNAVLDARKKIDRVERLAVDAGRWGIGSDRWRGLMASGSRLLRLAYKQVARFERAKVADVVHKRIAETKALALESLRSISDARVAVLEAQGNARAIAKVAREIRGIDPALAKAIAERGRWVRAGARGSRPADSVLDGGGRYFTGRGAGRLTGYELRWLGRRGYVPGRPAQPALKGTPGARPVPGSRGARPGGSRIGGGRVAGGGIGGTSSGARAPVRAAPGR